jgi:diguanylate cyclase (GGDEF)-like protein
VPLHRSHEEKAIGALVCGHQERAAMSGPELRNARNLGVIAAGALETAWTIEDARRNARTDPLTGLANRRGFSERFAQVISETDRYGGSAALVLLDVDFFKKVNDTYGHEAGDAVLVALGDVVAEGRRTVDLAARLGGEELALILPQTDVSSARDLAERLRKRIESLSVRTNSGEVRVTASFGVAEYSARSGEGDKVFERADQALYAAKRNGRNRVESA